MDRDYQALPIRELGENAGYRRPTQPRAARVTPESPALEVMTDLARGIRRAELTVGDIMTPARQVEVLALADAEAARVGHVLETLNRAGRQHALVVDFDVLPPPSLIDAPVRRTMVRGIFSISQLARQLGVALQGGGEVARTFSEIEAALGR